MNSGSEFICCKNLHSLLRIFSALILCSTLALNIKCAHAEDFTTMQTVGEGTVIEISGNSYTVTNEDEGVGLVNEGEITKIASSSFFGEQIGGGLVNLNVVGKIENVNFNEGYFGFLNQKYNDNIYGSTFTVNEIGIANTGLISEISNSAFTGNYTGILNGMEEGYSAGPIENAEIASIWTIKDSNFKDNIAGIVNSGLIKKVDNSVFDGNEAGIANITNNDYAANIDTISNSKFQNGVVGIMNEGNITKIDNSEFTNNREENSKRPEAVSNFAIGNMNSGMGIYNGYLIGEISNSKFDGNQAGIANEGYITNIKNSSFVNNKGDEDDSIGGAGIVNAGMINLIQDSSFVGNDIGIMNIQTESRSLMLYDANPAIAGEASINAIQNSNFEDNKIGIVNIGGNIDVIQNTSFKNNMGGLVNMGYNGLIQNSEFIGNNSVGAIMNAGLIENIETSLFDSNKNQEGRGGAIMNMGIVPRITNSVFKNNIAENLKLPKLRGLQNNEMDAYGGAIYNGFENRQEPSKLKAAPMVTSGAAPSSSSGNLVPSMVIVNTSFLNNGAISAAGDAKGGAIYSTSNIKIEANNGGSSLISGNYTISGGQRDDNAIYMASNTTVDYDYQYDEENDVYYDVEYYENKTSNLILDANTNGVIQIDDKISGEKGGGIWIDSTNEDTYETTTEVIKDNDENYKVVFQGDETGTIILNNNVENEADTHLDTTTLTLGKRDDVLQGNHMTFHSGTFDMINGNIGNTDFKTFKLLGDTNATADVDLYNVKMDRITAESYDYISKNANLNVNMLNLLNDAKEDKTVILYADKEFANNVKYTGKNPVAYSPIWKYDVSYDVHDDDLGYFTFLRGASGDYNSYNPSVLPAPVATQAGAYTTQMQAFEYAFKHSDAFMALPSPMRMAIINGDRYASAGVTDATDNGIFSPLVTGLDISGFWIKPYTTFENVPLKNGPKVSNISYGTLVGYDSNLKHLRNGWHRVLTGYLGYNGASQRYSGIDTYQNGGLLGGTMTFYKNNFFNATTLSVGSTVGISDTMYGSEDYTMLMSGIGNKFGYDFEFQDGKFILQPSLFLSYSFINTFDYTNAAGLKIKSDPLHAIQVAPGVKFIMNTENGWQPYLRVDMVWNILNDTKVKAGDVFLPEMSIKPYVQYGLGVQKQFKNDRLTFFGQALVQNGGRNGVGLNVGLRWAVGQE